MAFDGIVTYGIVEELKSLLIGSRLDKIFQPEKDEIILNMRNSGKNYKLLISASSNNPRIYLTEKNKLNPAEPPMFCMILRKHLSSGIILNIEQSGLDRIVFIDISSRDELGVIVEKRLAIEIMGRHSNIILINKEKNEIIDSIKRVYEDMSRVRQVFPGASYFLPPEQDKISPFDINKDAFLHLAKTSDLNLAKFLYTNILGFSPGIGREIAFMANLDHKSKMENLSQDELLSLYQQLEIVITNLQEKNFSPNILSSRDKILDFHIIELNQVENGNLISYPSISNMLDYYFAEKDTLDRVAQKSQSTRKVVQNNLDKNINKLRKIEKELEESHNREIYKVYGDLISANLYRIPKGSKEIDLENFYTENLEVLKIPLDIKLSPAQNSQKYYKKYSKLKNASILLEEQIRDTKDEITYLENVLTSLDQSTQVSDIDEIKEELILEGYIKSKINKKKKQNLSKPYEFLSSDGLTILVGKNNRQNDQLTLKTARKDDIWLHVQNMPGSHVIIQRDGHEVSEKTLEEAAILAGYFSKGRDAKALAIDYTERKFVKKAKGAKAGMVFYNDFKTIIINPSEEEFNKINEKKS